jgi:hypothetical protein
MLTGNVPYNDDNPMTVIQMHLHSQVPPMSDQIPYSVQQVVRRAMEKDPARRYQSAGEMMQHCQQVFAELNAGGVSVGGGGVPRTMIAGMPSPQQGMPQMQPQMQPQHMQPQHMQQGPYGGPPGMPPQGQGPGPAGYAPSAPQAKTMIAQVSPFAPGQPMAGMAQGGFQQQQQPPGAYPQANPAGGYQQANPAQKTIVAQAAPYGGMQPGMQPQMQPGMQPHMQPGMPGMQPGMPGAQGTPGGFAPAGSSGPNKTVLLQPSEGVVSVARGNGPVAAAPSGAPIVIEGASPLYWAVCLAIGITVGVLAYVIVLQAS